jgi:hypothetical protein
MFLFVIDLIQPCLSCGWFPTMTCPTNVPNVLFNSHDFIPHECAGALMVAPFDRATRKRGNTNSHLHSANTLQRRQEAT